MGIQIMFPKQCYSTCGLQTNSTSSTSEIMRNVPWAPSQTYSQNLQKIHHCLIKFSQGFLSVLKFENPCPKIQLEGEKSHIKYENGQPNE